MAERNIKLRSFKTTLPELHCDVYFVMARGNDLQKQVKNALKDFEKLGFAP